MDINEIIQARKSLSKALKEEKISIVLDIMNNLNERAVVTKELLKATEIGVFIGNQRSHKNAEVAKLAKEIIKKWRTAVGVNDSPSPRPNGVNGNSAKYDTSDNKLVNKLSTPRESGKNGKKQPTLATSKPPQRENSLSSTSSSSIPSTPDNERSFETDGIKITTNDTMRDKCLSLVYNALASGSDVDKSTILARATKIEQAVYDQFEGKSDKNYRDKLRSLILNLKDKSNPNLRKRVISGELPIDVFCTMSKEEMISEDRKARNNEIRQANLFKARGAGPTQAETDMFRCGKCNNRKCTYYQMQTRSADEPMTTFVTCTVCNNRWKFC
ncbi:10470_t:CDS:2 [Acaulospora morrowiae]|uniref:Transcription elongation factor n=1 Tax=Acaulospora morrowiae TaxID=94023 RepID=A0A9N9G6K8_9GLOM|nr:10470_t:CDS:2 [Acaulospora morrowiae]